MILIGLLLLSGVATAEQQSDYQRGLAVYASGDMFGAMEILKPAVDKGDTKSMALLAYILDKAEEDDQALLLYRRAAEQREPAALFGLGGMYAEGEGVDRDLAKARALMTQAAELGYVDAMKVVADAYETGALGVQVDLQQARDWWQRAAETGDQTATQRLVNMQTR